MDWKKDPNLLSKKIFERLEKAGVELMYSDLEKIAIEKEIDLNIFDAALNKLHRFKQVTQRTKGDDILYKAVPKPKRKQKEKKQCLVQITSKKSPFYTAMVYPLDEFKRENNVLYRYGAVLTPGFKENRIWFCPTDIGLKDDDLPLAMRAMPDFEMPFPEIDMSYLKLKRSEMLEFKAQMKGVPVHIMKQLNKFK